MSSHGLQPAVSFSMDANTGPEARSGSHPNSSCKYPNSFDLELAVIVARYVRQVIERFRKNAGIPAMFQTPHS